jgi:hypothetical protein
MATCEKCELQPEPPPVGYVLTLTEDEARQLRWVTNGYSWNGSAAALPHVHDALVRAGVGVWVAK